MFLSHMRCLGSQKMGVVSKSMRPEGFLGFLGRPERFLQQKEHCSNNQYEVHEKGYTGSDVAGVNKVRASAYGPGQQCKFGYGSGDGSEGRPFSLRIASVNVTTMKKRDGDVMDMAVRGRWDFCCLQETGWKSEGARKMGEYKFFWMGCAKGIHGVGLLVADR